MVEEPMELNLDNLPNIKVKKLWTFSNDDKKKLIKILWENKTKKLEEEQIKDFTGISCMFDINNDRSWREEQEKRRKKIQLLLNQEYYRKDSGWFDNSWKNTFYDEWDMIFAVFTWNSKIFTFDGEKLLDIWKAPYWRIERVWDYYEAIQAGTTNIGDVLHKKKWSEIYSILNKKWIKIKSLNWPLNLRCRDGECLYVEKYKRNKKQVSNLYDENLNLVIKWVPEDHEYLYKSNWYVLFGCIQWELFNDNKFIIIEEWTEWKYKYVDSNKLKESKIYLDYTSKSILDNQKK